MTIGYKRIKILSQAEIDDLYSLPKFTSEERSIFFALNKQENQLIRKMPDIPSKLHGILQLGYFKAKGKLFSFNYSEVELDLDFIIAQYFPHIRGHKNILLRAQKAVVNQQILGLFNFMPITSKTRKDLIEQALLLARIHGNHTDIFRELLSYLQVKNIEVPSYTVLQDIISLSIDIELKRIENIIANETNSEFRVFLSKLLEVDSNINISTLKLQASNFKNSQLREETAKALELSSIYAITSKIISKLDLSLKSIRYYASLVDEYNIYRLRRLKSSRKQIYLICYLHQRYQQLIDNLVTGFIYYNNNFVKEAAEYAKQQLLQHITNYNALVPKVSKLLRFMGTNADKIEPERFWHTAYNILPKAEYIPIADYIAGKAFDLEQAKWEFYTKNAQKIKTNMRMLFKAIDFSSDKQHHLIEAISHLKALFNKDRPLSKGADHLPDHFITKGMKKYLITSYVVDSKIITAYHPDRYELCVYQEIVKELDKGKIFCKESTKYKSLSADLLQDQTWQYKDELISKLGYPNIGINIEQRLNELEQLLHTKILSVNARINAKQNKHIRIRENKSAKNTKYQWYLTDSSRVNKIEDEFFDGIGNINISSLLHFINQQTNFCRAFEHIKPLYAKQKPNHSELIACIVANGFSFGTYIMSQNCDISYSTLTNAEMNFLSIDNLKHANDIISNTIASLAIFNTWNILPDGLLAAVDGQKFETKIDNFQSRYSSKYFGLNKGISAFSMVLNHVPVNCKIIGANEHESHYAYDIIYNNTAIADPDAISGDMHSINKVNFAILDSINKKFMPNFSKPQNQINNLRTMKPLALYQNCFIPPTKIINKKLIIQQWDHLQKIFVSLATGESTQATIIRKLSSHKHYSKVKTALWEYDSIFKSLYLLDFVDNHILRSQIRKSLNRIEAYHALRRAITKVHTGKLRGATIIENELWNQCGRLLANAIILYNSIIFDKLLANLDHSQVDNKKIHYLNSISPVRWKHINFIGKYEFKQATETTEIDSIVTKLQNNLQKLML